MSLLKLRSRIIAWNKLANDWEYHNPRRPAGSKLFKKSRQGKL